MNNKYKSTDREKSIEEMWTSKTKESKKKNTTTNNKTTALCGVLMALAMVMSYLESLIPVSFAVPGIKLGLANVVTIIALIRLGIKPAMIISLGRIILSGILFGNITIIIYSLAGGILSILVMCMAKKMRVFTITGISVAGGVSHNLGQLIVAAVVLENISVMYYFLVLGISGVVAGALIGIFAGVIMNNIQF